MENENDIIVNEDEQLEELEDEVIEQETDDTEEDSTDGKAVAEAEKQRRVKAEQAIAKAKAKKQEKPVEKELSDFAVEKTVLRSLGHSKEEIETLEKIAALNGSSLVDAKEDSIFKAWKQDFDKNVEREKASLGASKSSRQPSYSPEQQKERFLKSESPSREEIRALIHKKKN